MNGSDVIEPLYDRILGRVLAESLVDLKTGKVLVEAGQMVIEEHAEAIKCSGVDQALIRSALLCEAEKGICAACYGRDLARGTDVNIGEAVGVIAAQSIGEPGTQLTMRTFHVGGAAQRGAEQSNIEANIGGVVKLEDAALVTDKTGSKIVMSRNTELLILDEQERERSRFRLPYGGKLLINDGDEIAAGTILIEWDPYTMPIITEMNGIANFVDLTEGVSVREVTDDATGIASREVVDWKQAAGGTNLRPRITLRDEKGEVLTLANGLEARYFLSAGSILSVENGANVQAGDVLARIPIDLPRHVILQAACREWLNCLKPVGLKILRLFRKGKAALSLAMTTKPNAASELCQQTAILMPLNICCRKVAPLPSMKGM